MSVGVLLLRYAALFSVFAWFLLGGMGHLLDTEYFVGIMPPYIPYFLHKPLVFFSGVFEVLFALALLVPLFRKWAGNLLITLTVAFTPANVHLWLNREQFNVDENRLMVWLAFQVLLVVLIWWSTRVTHGDNRAPEPVGKDGGMNVVS